MFGPNPSSEVRALGRVESAAAVNIEWSNIQLEPYLNSSALRIIPVQHRRRLLRGVGKLLSPFIFLANANRIARADVVYVIKTPPIWLSKLLRHFSSPVILDFDDPIWIDSMKGEVWFRKTLKNYDGFTCDNIFTLEYASRVGTEFGDIRGIILPGELPQTCTGRTRNVKTHSGGTTFIWPGSFSTFRYLASIADSLRSHLASYPGDQIIILGPTIAQLETLALPKDQVHYIGEYGPDELAASLGAADIGLFPLLDEELAYLRGTHKVHLYNSYSIPTIATKVRGLNSAMVNELNGLEVETSESWIAPLSRLSEDTDLRSTLAKGAKIQHEKYLSRLSQVADELVEFAHAVDR